MALYHFTLKSDTKPSKKKVKAVEHIEYINREGKYANQDELEKKNLDNIITSAKIRDVFHGTPALLYHSSYGDISNTEKGIAVYQSPSLDTVSIALMVAHEKMNAPLIIYGSEVFKAKCISAAVVADLPITFADETMQKIFIRKKEEDQHERKKFEQQGGRYIRNGQNIPKPDINGSGCLLSAAPTIRTLPTLRSLPKLSLVRRGQEPPEMPLPDHAHDLVGHAGPDDDADVRRIVHYRGEPRVRPDFRDGRRARARRTADRVLKVLEENADLVKAATHVEYINRESAFEKKGGCVYQEHRLPDWANDSAKNFFQAADRYSPSNTARYKEFEFALQNELTLEQKLEIIHKFIEKVLPDNYYALAVHDKIGTLSGASHNLHVHLMFSPRQIDEIEKTSPRKKSHFFSYPLRKNVKNPTEKMRRGHGSPTDPRFIDRKYLREFREIYAQITNEILEKYNKRARVDFRSLKDQEMDAMLRQDTVLQKILHRIPEQHISRLGILEERNPDVKKIQDYRKQKTEYFDQLMEADLKENQEREQSIEKADRVLQEKIHLMLNSDEFQESDNDPESYQNQLRQGFYEAREDYEKAKAGIIPVEQAYGTARMEYLSDEEQEFYRDYMELINGIKQRTEFQKTFRLTPNATDEDKKAFQELQTQLQAELKQMEMYKTVAKRTFNDMLKKLENPDVKKQIHLIAHRILEGNKWQQKKVEAAGRTLDVAVAALQESLHAVDHYEKSRLDYHTHDLYKIIRRRYFACLRDIQRLQAQVESARKRVLTPKQVQEITEDRFTRGAMKKYREGVRKYNREYREFRADQAKVQELKKKRTAFPAGSREWEEISRQIRTMEQPIQRNGEKLHRWYLTLTAQKKDLDQRMSAPNAVGKMKQISLAVVRDNSKDRLRYEQLSKQLHEAQARLDRLTPQMQALEKAVQRDKKNTRRYRVNPFMLPKNSPPPAKLDQPDMIARAIAGEPGMPHNVVCRDDDDLGMKNWVMMDDLAREEEYNKRFSRNL